MQYCSSFEGVSAFGQAVLLLPCSANNPYPRPGLNLVINPYKLALLPTASRDKAFLVIVIQFSIGKMIKRRQNSITVYQIDRTGYHFRNQWATLIHSFIPAISIAPLQVLYYSEALPTTARILYRSFTPKRTNIQTTLLNNRDSTQRVKRSLVCSRVFILT